MKKDLVNKLIHSISSPKDPKYLDNNFIYSEESSPLTNLCYYLTNRENILNIKEQFIFHNKILNSFVSIYKPSSNQLTFIRAVSLNSIFKNNDFPKIGSFTNDSIDNIRFEPLFNKNLLLINQHSLQNLLLTIVDIELRQHIYDEMKIIEREIPNIDSIINKVPEILIKDLTGGIKRLSSNPKVSVITASYNLASMVEETMRSIANQNYENFEHIVIDGASKDGSIELLKKYPNIILVSEKDTGYPDAFWKGLRLAKGEYIMQCCVSDGYSTVNWIKHCVEVLDKNRDVSMVWGMVAGLNQQSLATNAGYSQFNYTEAPQREHMFDYWIKTGISQPETNLCVRKNVLLKCYPTTEECKKDILDWLEFTYRFNIYGYLAQHLPILANYSHVDHANKMTLQLRKSGQYKRQLNNYRLKITAYKWKLLCGLSTHRFIDADGNILPTKFNRKQLIFNTVNDTIQRYKKHLVFLKHIPLIKKLW